MDSCSKRRISACGQLSLSARSERFKKPNQAQQVQDATVTSYVLKIQRAALSMGFKFK